MARVDLYRMSRTSYLIDVQNDLLVDFGQRVVIPLISPMGLPKPIPTLHPTLILDGEPHVLITHRLNSVEKLRLGLPVANLAQYRDDIVRALDVLFIGL